MTAAYNTDKGTFPKKLKILSENRMDALADLHINPTHNKKRDESGAFLLYLNYAVNTICDIGKLDKNISKPDGAVNALKEKKVKEDPGVLRKLANFFWLFNQEEPDRDFPDYEEKTLAIVKKIFELRIYFAHLKENGVAPLVIDRKMYEFLGGILYGQALEHSVLPGLRTAKLFKMKLFAVRNKEQGLYEFTRRGLIFFICLALYKDDAMEFTQCLEDMKLPTCPKKRDMESDCSCECEDIATCKPGVAKAFITLFTYFSARRGRSVALLEDDYNYLAFADLSNYLNKVPAASFAYLALEKENAIMKALYDDSEESEENKIFKYTLHKRAKERFLSFATAYCEDFDVMPALKFKRLDISENIGRKRYLFGKDQDNRVHMDRHYHIYKDAVRFAWEPKKHYGPIHIDSLRSAMSSACMKELLFASFNGGKVNQEIDQYFEAYHRILETMINTQDTDNLYMTEELQKDFARVAGVSSAALDEDFAPVDHYFPKNLMRFFYGEEGIPENRELLTALQNKLRALWDHAADFDARLQKFDEWKEELGKLREKDPEAKLPVPMCSSKEVLNPPRSCRISDAALIAWVFRYFNLYLSNEKKFRQLPPGEQHRGVLDHEYQLVHALIGKYSLDPKGLESYISKHKSELLPAWETLNSKLRKLRREAETRLGRRMRTVPLSMLAQAAVQSYIAFVREALSRWERNTASADPAALRTACRKFGIRTGMPKDRTSLIKSILHIDLASYLKAYDRERRKNFENRSLEDSGHAVSQIPFPNEFARRIMADTRKLDLQEFLVEKDGEKSFDFQKAFHKWETEIVPRDFYDAAPLIEGNIALKEGRSLDGIKGLRRDFEEGELPPDLSRSGLKKAIQMIKETRNQDKLLLKIANAYWTSFQAQGAFSCEKKSSPVLAEKPSIYEYFSAAVLIKFPKEKTRSIKLMPNDVNRPILSQILANAPVIASVMDPAGEKQEFEFYEMLKVYRSLQSADRAVRLELIPYINAFDAAVTIPLENYVKGGDNRSMEFSWYKGKFSALTREEYDTIVDLRDSIFHRDLNLKAGNVPELLKKYVQLPKRQERKKYPYKKRY